MSGADALWALVASEQPWSRGERDHAVVGTGHERRLAGRFDEGPHGAEYQRRERLDDVLVRVAAADGAPFGFWLHGRADDEPGCEIAARRALLELVAAMRGCAYADASATHNAFRGRPADLHGIQPLTCRDGSRVVVSWRWSARRAWDGRSTRYPAVRVEGGRWWLLVVVDVERAIGGAA